MRKFSLPLIYCKACFVVSTFLLLVSCVPTSLMLTNTPIIKTIRETQIVTRVVTQDITLEVTRVVEVPATVTPSVTPLYTYTPSMTPTITGTPTPTATPEPPVVSVLDHSDCFYGPDQEYLYKYSVFPDQQVEAVGRNLDGSWLYIQELHAWNPCWIQVSKVKGNVNVIAALPVVISKVPISNDYNPPDAIARRQGSEVTISWKAVWMSTDNYRGYLIEAWLCQGGKLLFVPTFVIPPYADNTGTLSVKVTDEQGCDLPSSANIYTAEKLGYSARGKIPWPP